MTYTVHSIFKTIQGEGFHAGSAAVFCRFAGCNLWSGREQDRVRAACKFCDTDFVGGTKYESAETLAEALNDPCQMVVFTGGEPLLQLDRTLVSAIRGAVHVETNGSLAPPRVSWLTVSPKAGVPVHPMARVYADELKIVFPQDMDYEEMARAFGGRHLFLQPMAGLKQEENTAMAIEYILQHPWWRLSLQTHKFVGIP